MPGRTDHLFKRARSPFWHARFHYPRGLHEHFGRKMTDINLKTLDRREAELLLPDLLKRHRLDICEAENKTKRRLRVAGFKYVHELGDRVEEDGTRVIATQDTVVFIRDGQIVREEENDLRIVPTFRFEHEAQAKAPPKKAVDKDIEHVERWVAHKGINEYLAKEAREAFRLFKELSGGKLFKDASRDDGRKLVTHLFEVVGNKSATVQKKVGHLCAAVHLAIDEGHLTFNPFSKIIPNVKDAKKRPPVSDGDMTVIREGLLTLKPEERLLFMLCATTGMRRGEAYSISAERVIAGMRCVKIGTKTEQSERDIPLPSAVLPFLPAKIDGPLFKKDLKNLGRETLRSIRRLGIENPEACIHGLRHRAADRLKNEARLDGQKCQDSMRWAILGHEEKTVAENYGQGYAMWEIKPWIEQIWA